MKNLILAALLAGAAVTAMAQEDVLRPNGRPAGSTSSSSSQRSSSESVWIIGPEVGANFNFFSSDLNGTFDKSPFNAFGSASGISPFFGAYIEYSLTRQFGIGARVFYDMKSIKNTVDAEVDCPDVSGSFVSIAPLTSTIEETVNYVTINPLIRWSPIEQLVVHFGPVLQFAAGNVKSTFTLALPSDGTCRFNPGTADESTTNTSTSDAPAQNSSRFGLDLGVGYRIPIAPAIALVPRIGYQFMFTPYGPDGNAVDNSHLQTQGPRPFTQTNLSLTSLQASLALWFTI